MDHDFKIIDLQYEYDDFVGGSPIAVITNLSQKELLHKYPSLKEKMPFILFTERQWLKFLAVSRDFKRNDEKFRKRGERHGDKFGYRDGETELFMKCLEIDAVEREAFSNIEKEKLLRALEYLNENQRRRISMYYFQGFTYRQIAELEGVSDMSVRASISGAIKKLKNIF